MKTLILASVLLSTSLYAQVDCSVLTGCAQKSCRIASELEGARKQKNSPKIAGLEKALKESTANCKDENLTQKHQDKIQKQKEKILELEADLTKARLKGKKEKIIKLEKKLDDEKAELIKMMKQN